MKYLTRILQGIIIGTAEVMPGVSGSTMALIMGIYDDFIDFLHSIVSLAIATLKLLVVRITFKEYKKKFKSIRWQFGFLLGVGILLALALGANILSGLIENNRPQLYAFFFGLVIASVSIPFGEVKKWSSKTIGVAAIATLVTFVLMGISPAESKFIPGLAYVFLGGMLGISGMVLPGVSGAFILLILGLYDLLIDVFKTLTRLQITVDDLLIVLFFIAGAAVGFGLLVKSLKVALDRYRDVLMAILVGLMLGSLRVLWPFFHEAEGQITKLSPFEVPSGDLALAIGLMLGAVVFVLVVRRLSKETK